MGYRQGLLVSLLLTAGCQDVGTYGKRCSAPLAHWRKQSEGINHHAISAHVRLASNGSITWNGLKVTQSKLSTLLDESRSMNPSPFIILSAEADTACNRVRAIRTLMDARYCSRHWACGEGSRRSKDWDPIMDLPPPAELDRLGKQADAASRAADSCPTRSDLGRVEGTDGTEPSHYR